MANFPDLWLKSTIFPILFVEFPTYDKTRLIFFMNKIKKN